MSTQNVEVREVEGEVVEPPRVTVHFERSVRVREFENATASIFIQVPTNPGDNLETIVEKARPTFLAAKSTIFEQLGIQFEVNTDQVAIELLERELGAVEVHEVAEAQVEATAVATTTNTAPQHKSSGGNRVPAPATKEGQWQELKAYPKRYFDNRDNKRSPQAPDFKRKYTGEGLWLDSAPDGFVAPEPSAF